ncbi:hypothetical protein GCM10009845_23230 [Pedococcus bigeumensis]
MVGSPRLGGYAACTRSVRGSSARPVPFGGGLRAPGKDSVNYVNLRNPEPRRDDDRPENPCTLE